MLGQRRHPPNASLTDVCHRRPCPPPSPPPPPQTCSAGCLAGRSLCAPPTTSCKSSSSRCVLCMLRACCVHAAMPPGAAQVGRPLRLRPCADAACSAPRSRHVGLLLPCIHAATRQPRQLLGRRCDFPPIHPSQSGLYKRPFEIPAKAKAAFRTYVMTNVAFKRVRAALRRAARAAQLHLLRCAALPPGLAACMVRACGVCGWCDSIPRSTVCSAASQIPHAGQLPPTSLPLHVLATSSACCKGNCSAPPATPAPPARPLAATRPAPAPPPPPPPPRPDNHPPRPTRPVQPSCCCCPHPMPLLRSLA